MSQNPFEKQTVLSILGTRPEAIKMAPVVRAIEHHSGYFKSLVCVTGQHREMLDQVLTIFGIKPDINLGVMTANQTLSQLTARLFEAIDEAVSRSKPDWVLAQGDTTTVAVAAIVSFYHRIKFGHIEAGLRTGDRFSPFPEEVNRRIADLLAAAYFAPTERARETLVREGCNPKAVFVTGNTGIDALLDVAARPFNWETSVMAAIPASARLVLITAHRRESFGEPFRELCLAIRELATRFAAEGVHFVYPVHLNPNVRKPVNEILIGLANIHLIEPIDYCSMAHLMKHAELILTDSGGIQEEAPSFGIPLLVMRDSTERPEGIDAGTAKLVGTSRERIIAEASHLLADSTARAAWPRGRNPYGDGQAASRIVKVLIGWNKSGQD